MRKSDTFDTGAFFPGGGGFFVEFHDIIKPVYLYAIFSLFLSSEHYGLPTYILENFSILSVIEWYKNRRYRNPLMQLDWMHKSDPETLDTIMKEILQDESIYRLAPVLTLDRLLYVYNSQHMVFPWYIYSDEYEKPIESECKRLFAGVDFTYVYGDLETSISKCRENFTYIFSDVEKVKKLSDLLMGTCNNILLARDYRYNYIDNFKHFKYDLNKLAINHPFLRIETTLGMDYNLLENKFDNLMMTKRRGGDIVE